MVMMQQNFFKMERLLKHMVILMLTVLVRYGIMKILGLTKTMVLGPTAEQIVRMVQLQLKHPHVHIHCVHYHRPQI